MEPTAEDGYVSIDVMDEEIPYKPSQIGKLHEAPETLPAPPDPHNCRKVFNYLECLLVCCKQTLRALLLRLVALRPRLRRRDWRRGVVLLVEPREIIRRLSCWVGWRGVLSIGDTALILGLFLLHEKLSSFCCSLQRWLQRMQMSIAVSGIQVSSFRLPSRCWGCLYSPYCR